MSDLRGCTDCCPAPRQSAPGNASESITDTHLYLRSCMSTHSHTCTRHDRLADFTRDTRILVVTLMAFVLGASSAVIAAILVRLIALVTNLAFYQHFSFADSSPAGSTL